MRRTRNQYFVSTTAAMSFRARLTKFPRQAEALAPWGVFTLSRGLLSKTDCDDVAFICYSTLIIAVLTFSIGLLFLECLFDRLERGPSFFELLFLLFGKRESSP